MPSDKDNIHDDASQSRSVFRLSGKSIFCTYSQTPKDWDHKRVLAWLGTALAPYCIKTYSIGREKHADGLGEHWHCYIALDRKANIRDARRLDLEGVHGNYKVARKQHIAYSQKDGDFITNIDGKASYIELARKGDFQGAELAFAEAHPKEYLLHLQSVRKNILALSPCSPRVLYHGPYSQSVHQALEGWNRSLFTMFLTGPSGVGKTQWALTLAKNPLLVSHMDGLKQLTRTTDLIIFDDMSFRHLPRVANIHIVDVECERQINVKHGIVQIPAGMPRIITSNLGSDEVFAEDSAGAIKRRIYEINWWYAYAKLLCG